MHHKEKWKKVFHKIVYIAGILASVVTIPQLLKIWIDKDVSGVSLITWSLYLVIAVLFAFYGKFHKEKVMIITYSLLAFVELFIIIGIIVYS